MFVCLFVTICQLVSLLNLVCVFVCVSVRVYGWFWISSCVCFSRVCVGVSVCFSVCVCMFVCAIVVVCVCVCE